MEFLYDNPCHCTWIYHGVYENKRCVVLCCSVTSRRLTGNTVLTTNAFQRLTFDFCEQVNVTMDKSERDCNIEWMNCIELLEWRVSWMIDCEDACCVVAWWRVRRLPLVAASKELSNRRRSRCRCRRCRCRYRIIICCCCWWWWWWLRSVLVVVVSCFVGSNIQLQANICFSLEKSHITTYSNTLDSRLLL